MTEVINYPVGQGIKVDDRAFCEDCGKQFTQRSSLFTHMRRTHGKEPEVTRNKSNHSKSRLLVEQDIMAEAYPELGREEVKEVVQTS